MIQSISNPKEMFQTKFCLKNLGKILETLSTAVSILSKRAQINLANKQKQNKQNKRKLRTLRTYSRKIRCLFGLSRLCTLHVVNDGP